MRKPLLRPEQDEHGTSQTGEYDLTVEIDGDCATLFDDMKHVRRYPKATDRTQGQKDARRWKDKDFKAFMAKYADLEKAWMMKEPQQQEPDEPVRDKGKERVEVAIQRLLDEAKEGL